MTDCVKDPTENKCTENKCTENKCTENKCTENKCTEELIQEWIQEDRYLVRYSRRQKTILTQNLLHKLSCAKEKETIQDLETKIARYRKAYQTLLREGHPSRLVNRICQIIWMIWVVLFVNFMKREVISAIPRGECSATELPQIEQYKTIDQAW